MKKGHEMKTEAEKDTERARQAVRSIFDCRLPSRLYSTQMDDLGDDAWASIDIQGGGS